MDTVYHVSHRQRNPFSRLLEVLPLLLRSVRPMRTLADVSGCLQQQQQKPRPYSPYTTDCVDTVYHVSHSQRNPFFRLEVLPLLLPAAHDCANCVLSFWQSS